MWGGQGECSVHMDYVGAMLCVGGGVSTLWGPCCVGEVKANAMYTLTGMFELFEHLMTSPCVQVHCTSRPVIIYKYRGTDAYSTPHIINNGHASDLIWFIDLHKINI